MATYYWVGGSGTWDAATTTNWSLTSGGAGGAGVPTASDNVQIDGSSGSGTIITGVGATAAGVTINNSNITLQLGDDITTTALFFLQQGSLNLNNFNAYINSLNFNNSNTRSITSGSGQFFLTGQNATLLAANTVTNLTYGDRATYNISANASSGTRTVQHGFISNQSLIPNFNFTAGSDTVIFNPASAFNVNFTGFSGTLSNSARNIYGSLVLSATMTLAAGGNKTDFRGTTPGNTITTNGRLIDFPLEFVATGSSWILQDNLTLGDTRALTLTTGTLNANGYDVTVGTFISTGTGARTLTLGSGTWTVLGGGATAWDTTASLIVSASTGVINMTSASDKTFVGSGKTWPTLNQGGLGALTISGSNTFANIANTVQPATITLTAGTTQTVTSFGVSGTAGNLITLNSSSAGSQATLSDSSGVNSVSYTSIKDINATGGSIWDAPTTAGNVDAGNNLGWNFGIPFNYDIEFSPALRSFTERKQF